MTQKQQTEWFLGIDLGTGSCKSVIIDAQSRLLGFGAHGYASDDNNRQGEQDPEELIHAIVGSVRVAIEDAGVSPGACQAMSIGGAYHSLIAMDRSDTPLSGMMTWVDNRATKQALAIRES